MIMMMDTAIFINCRDYLSFNRLDAFYYFAVPVYLSEKPQSALVTEGSNAVNLTCSAMGDPLPTITWKKLDGSRDIDEDR